MVLDKYRAVMVGTSWYWFSIGWYWPVVGGIPVTIVSIRWGEVYFIL